MAVLVQGFFVYRIWKRKCAPRLSRAPRSHSRPRLNSEQQELLPRGARRGHVSIPLWRAHRIRRQGVRRALLEFARMQKLIGRVFRF